MMPTLSVSEFVNVFNQTMGMVLPEVNLTGELANLRISKNRWVYFDLKDGQSSVKFFGPVTILPGPLENGMNLEVNGYPRLHNLYGFSINVNRLKAVGVGSIAKAQALLAKKLEAEGLFSAERKRGLPQASARIGLITSIESAAYSDFVKIINHRWGRLEIEIIDCLVQGNDAPDQIINAISAFNQMADPPEVLVIIRGGGSADDLAVFSTEQVVRAVSASRLPTIVAIGHERDISLAELAADQRASTPSNAAELMVPDRRHEKDRLTQAQKTLAETLKDILSQKQLDIDNDKNYLSRILNTKVEQERSYLNHAVGLSKAMDPKLPLAKGYVLARDGQGKQLRLASAVKIKDELSLEFKDGYVKTTAGEINEK